jgi:hypothetical protein
MVIVGISCTISAVTLSTRNFMHNICSYSFHQLIDRYYYKNITEDYVGWVCSTHVEMTITYKMLVKSPKGKTPLGTHRSRWGDKLGWI